MANKQFNAIPQTALAQEVAMATWGRGLGFGLTAGDGLRPMSQAELNHIPDG